jgi:hypothetical protein
MDRSPSTSSAEQTFIEQMPAHIAVFDCEMRYVAVSQRFLSDMAYLFATEVSLPPRSLASPITKRSQTCRGAGAIFIPAF